MNNSTTYLIHRHSWMRWMVVDALKITVCFVVYLLTKVLVCLGPDLRKVSWKKKKKTKIRKTFLTKTHLLERCNQTVIKQEPSY